MVQLLLDLCGAGQSSRVAAVVADRLARTLVGHGATRAEIGWWERRGEPVVVVHGPEGDDPGPLAPESVARALTEGRVELARGRARDVAVRLPLEGANGWLRVTAPARFFQPEEAVAAVAGVVALALAQGLVVGRVAALSRAAHEEGAELRRRLDALVGPEGIVGLGGVIERADLVAPHPTTVLLLGESGTGKELVARRLHRLSGRAGPFVAVNCGAIPEALVESELFGHEKGAFTGAAGAHRGVFERAKGGTLFLDEVGDLPKRAQVKLLRALQERTVERVGGERPIAVDVRVVAATHRALERLVEKKRFREDLYHRLATFPIRIPPLRERLAELPALVEHLLVGINERLGRRLRVPAGGLARLAEREWRGNVRELANVLERAAILSPGDELVLDELPEAPPRKGPVAIETFEEAARRCIERALEACGGRVYGPRGAAARLGLRPSTLQGKMRRFGIRIEPRRCS